MPDPPKAPHNRIDRIGSLKGCLFESFGQPNRRFGTPTLAVVFSGVITFLGALLGRGALLAVIDVGSLCIVLAFLGVSLSLLKLRVTQIREGAKVTWPKFALPILSSIGAISILGVMIVPGSPGALDWPLEWLILMGLVALGLAFWLGGTGVRRRLTESEREGMILGDPNKEAQNAMTLGRPDTLRTAPIYGV